MSVPWGDVSTAFYTTGIPNIEVFVPAPPKMILRENDELLPPCIKTSMPCKSLLNHVLKTVVGPNENFARKYLPMFGVRQEIRVGKSKLPAFKRKNAYSLTVNGSLTVVNYLLKIP